MPRIRKGFRFSFKKAAFAKMCLLKNDVYTSEIWATLWMSLVWNRFLHIFRPQQWKHLISKQVEIFCNGFRDSLSSCSMSSPNSTNWSSSSSYLQRYKIYQVLTNLGIRDSHISPVLWQICYPLWENFVLKTASRMVADLLEFIRISAHILIHTRSLFLGSPLNTISIFIVIY